MVGPPERKRFLHISLAGILFQGGAAALDASTIVAALVHGLSGSAWAVGAAAAIARFGWLFPQIFVAHFAQRRRQRMALYAFGAFGRAACILALACLLGLAATIPTDLIVPAFFLLWTLYAFVSGVVAVPYNDIVARAIPSARRSRMLAIRFLGGGLLALGVAALAHWLLDWLPFPRGYAGVFLIAAVLLLGSATSFVMGGEPAAPTGEGRDGFWKFLRGGAEVLRHDSRFRYFLGAQWLGGLVTMALPFYVLQALSGPSFVEEDVALLVGAQTTGALLSNALWGWWGDRRGKLSLLRLVAALGAAAPTLTLLRLGSGGLAPDGDLAWFALVFFILGAEGNGRTIAYLGYLMEISPDERRPAYSGYFNVLVAPVYLLPIGAAGLAEITSFAAFFGISLAAAALQALALRRLARIGR